VTFDQFIENKANRRAIADEVQYYRKVPEALHPRIAEREARLISTALATAN
jgi:hypothetical protein